MKKITRILPAILACALYLSACGGASDPAEYELSAVQAIADAGAFSETLEPLDGDIVFALYKLADYGLSREDLLQCAALRSSGATCEEAAVLLIQDDGEKIDQAKQALEDYVQSQIDANRDYRPAEIPKLEGAMIDCRGASLLLVVASDLDAAQSALE